MPNYATARSTAERALGCTTIGPMRADDIGATLVGPSDG